MAAIEIESISVLSDELCEQIDATVRKHQDDDEYLKNLALVLLAKSVFIQEMAENPESKAKLLSDNLHGGQ